MAEEFTNRNSSTESSRPLVVEKGRFHAYFIYDVADTIDLGKLSSDQNIAYEKAQIDLRQPASPSYIKFEVPPLVVKAAEREIDGHKAELRLKFYDYGILSIRISFEFAGALSEFSDFTKKLRSSEQLWHCAAKLLDDGLKQISTCLKKPHKPLLEDYFVFEVNEFKNELNSQDLLNDFRQELSCLLLAESRKLSPFEESDSLKVSYSYFDSDLLLIHWDSAFVYDSREGAEAVESILEFANTQLVELRTYDERLDAELDEIYKWDVTRAQAHWL
ncbi:MAG: hypothetical protein K2X27_24405, partial [Candidatus Obscuribacterales bacterium]|nr:hypothetical protein [Candidatus Obscuribacterales bacterium]